MHSTNNYDMDQPEPLKTEPDNSNNEIDGPASTSSYNVKSYYQAKLRMRNSLERAFANQVHQYHHDYRERRNGGAGTDNFKTLQPVERD